jgi:hypothetical protein
LVLYHDGKVPQEDRNRDRQGEQHKEVCLWLVLSRGFPPGGESSRVLETHGCILGIPPLFWLSNHTDLGSEEMSFHGCQNINCWCEVLWTSVEGLCLHRLGNWFVRQLVDFEPKLVYEIEFVREK